MHDRPASEVIADRSAARQLLAAAEGSYSGDSITFEMTICEPTSNPALFIDVEAPLGLGRVTWWSDGSLFAEALQKVDGKNVFASHLDAPSSSKCLHALDAVVAALLGRPSNPSIEPTPTGAAHVKR
jgi:hypothetical protein